MSAPVFPDQAARPCACQPHHGGADVPVFGRRRRGQRLAFHPYQHAGAVGRGDVLHRGHPCRADRPHHTGLPRAVERRHRSGAEADPGFSAQAFEDRGGDATRPCRPQGLEPEALGRRAVDPGGRRRLADGRPSALPHKEGEAAPLALDAAGLARIRDAFVAAAKRAERLGIDALELHGAHGYLLHEFLSPISNRRTDQYGGSLENMRYPLEVFDAVRAAFPAEKPIGVKVSATDWVEGGWDLAQTVEFAKELKTRGVDWIDASSGGISPLQKIPLSPGYQVPFAQAIREATGLTTMAVGPDHGSQAGRGDRGLRQGRHGRARPRHALRPALGLARRRRTRRPGYRTAAILALAARNAEGAVRRHHVRRAVGDAHIAPSFLLPLWEKVARTKSVPDEGLYPRRETPHPSSLREATFSHKGRREEAACHAVPRFTPAHLSYLGHTPGVLCSSRAHQTRLQKQNDERKPHGNRLFHHALASAGVRLEGGPRLGPAGHPLARRTRLPGGLDRRAPHRAVGAAPGARPLAGAGVPADQEHPPRARRFPAALSPPGRTRQPRRDARPSLGRPAQFRRRGIRPAERLGDVQRRRHVRTEPRHDPRGAGDHPEDVDRGRAVDAQGQVLDRHKTRHHVRFPQAPHQAEAGAASADRRRRPLQGKRHAEARRRARLHSDEPQPQPGLCRQPLGFGRGGRGPHRAQAEPQGLAAGARGVRRRHRRGSLEDCRPAT